MPPFSPKPTRSYNIRSISFPARSHPNIHKIEEKLNNLSSWNESSSSDTESIRAGLTALKEIYTYIENLLNLPLTQQALAQHQQEKWVSDMLDGLIKYLDICSNTRDSILSIKESVREIQSALRRIKAGGELSIENNINFYFCSRKKMKKETEKFLALLKQNDNNHNICSNAEDQYLASVVKSIREANWVSVLVFRSLLLLLSAPILKPKTRKWSLFSKLVNRGVVVCESEEEKMNELENVDVVLTMLLVSNSRNQLEEEKIQSAQKMLEVLDVSIGELENELECLFRHLIHTRVSLLNIVSHQSE